MKKRKPYKLPEIKTKSKGSQIRMASAPRQHSKKVEENGAILSKFWEEIISSYYPLPSPTINQVWRKKRDILNAQGCKKQAGLVGPGFYIILGALFKKKKWNYKYKIGCECEYLFILRKEITKNVDHRSSGLFLLKSLSKIYQKCFLVASWLFLSTWQLVAVCSPHRPMSFISSRINCLCFLALFLRKLTSMPRRNEKAWNPRNRNSVQFTGW